MASLREFLEDFTTRAVEGIISNPEPVLRMMWWLDPPTNFDYDEFADRINEKKDEIINAVVNAVQNEAKYMWLPDEDLIQLFRYERFPENPRLSRDIEDWEKLARSLYKAYEKTLEDWITEIYYETLERRRRKKRRTR